MIKFFRKIRQNLVLENKTGKYLKYAMGEIILVVIGILIALQINNWNEKNKEQAKTQTYYTQLLEDLHKDKAFAKNTIEKFEEQRKAYQDYLKKFNTTNVTLKTMYQNLIGLNQESFAINFNTSTIESLQNSGEIVLIPPLLRNKLIDLRRQQEKITQDESLDNNGKTGVAERLSMLQGAFGLEERLQNQEEIRASLHIEQKRSEIILGLEAIQDWMDFSEKKSMRLLKELIQEIELVENLIEKEAKTND
jgi:hypothetical protein